MMGVAVWRRTEEEVPERGQSQHHLTADDCFSHLHGFGWPQTCQQSFSLLKQHFIWKLMLLMWSLFDFLHS